MARFVALLGMLLTVLATIEIARRWADTATPVFFPVTASLLLGGAATALVVLLIIRR
jgi:hypothetical protein